MKKSLFSKLLSGVMSLGVLSGNNLMPNRVCAMENLDDESYGEEELSDIETAMNVKRNVPARNLDTVDPMVRCALAVLNFLLPFLGPWLGHTYAGGKNEGLFSFASTLASGTLIFYASDFLTNAEEKLTKQLIDLVWSNRQAVLTYYKKRALPVGFGHMLSQDGELVSLNVVADSERVGAVVDLCKVFSSINIDITTVIKNFTKLTKEGNDYSYNNQKITGLTDDQYNLLKQYVSYEASCKMVKMVQKSIYILHTAGWSVYDIVRALGKI